MREVGWEVGNDFLSVNAACALRVGLVILNLLYNCLRIMQ